jgi:hypothetical protein
MLNAYLGYTQPDTLGTSLPDAVRKGWGLAAPSRNVITLVNKRRPDSRASGATAGFGER